jgi:hypothetical protein
MARGLGELLLCDLVWQIEARFFNDDRRRSRADQAAAKRRNRSCCLKRFSRMAPRQRRRALSLYPRRPLKRGLTLQYLAAPSPDFLDNDTIVLFTLAVARAGFQNVGVNREKRQLLPGFARLVEHEVGVL